MCRKTSKENWKGVPFEYTDIRNAFFTPHNLGRYFTLKACHCCILRHSLTDVIPDHCCVLGHSCMNVIPNRSRQQCPPTMTLGHFALIWSQVPLLRNDGNLWIPLIHYNGFDFLELFPSMELSYYTYNFTIQKRIKIRRKGWRAHILYIVIFSAANVTWGKCL